MADETVKSPFSVVATTSGRLKDLVIRNGQMIFVQDKGRIAFDFNDKRVFYNQITELETEYERATLESPASGYYFIIETAVLWHYDHEWTAVTGKPDEVVFIGTELPELGNAKEKTLYVNKNKKEVAVYDKDRNEYVVVADKTDGAVRIGTVTDEDIDSLF